MEETDKIQMRKRNMKLFPICRTLGWDYLFFYTINFLFLTQIKGINPADIVLIDAFYSLFGVITQIPASFLIEFLGRKNSVILANIVNCMYITVIIFSKGLFDLVIAEILCSLAFAIKDSAEPAILNASIPPTKNRSKLFAKISQKGVAGYYIMNAISTILAGFLYEINPFIPISLSLGTLVIVVILSTQYIEPVPKKGKKQIKIKEPLKEIKESLQFILKTERVKSLILFVAVMEGILIILDTYELNLMEELNVSAAMLGTLFAGLKVLSGLASKIQNKFHERNKNTSLKKLGFSVVGSCLVSGIIGILAKDWKIAIGIIILAYGIKFICVGIYDSLMEKYLSNFTNQKIDTKIFTTNNFCKSIATAIAGIGGAFLLERMETAYCMIIVGIIFAILMTLVSKYMKTRVGLDPNEYTKEELKYDSLKQIERV